MDRISAIEKDFLKNIKVGWFLAKRDIRRANIWTTTLIMAVMTLTFLNLVVVSGILIGLIQGSEDAQKKYSIGDVVITSFLNRSYILDTQNVVNIVKTIPNYKNHTVRYSGSARFESDYRSTIKPGNYAMAPGGHSWVSTQRKKRNFLEFPSLLSVDLI